MSAEFCCLGLCETRFDQMAFDEETKQLVDESKLRREVVRDAVALLKRAVNRSEYDSRIATTDRVSENRRECRA